MNKSYITPLKFTALILILFLWQVKAYSQQQLDSVSHVHSDTLVSPIDSVAHVKVDTVLRIKNLNPYFTLHVDSTLNYQMEINHDPSKYYWYLRNSPVGLRLNKDNGMLTFKVEKSFFLSGK